MRVFAEFVIFFSAQCYRRYAFLDFSSADEANICLSTVHGSHFDKSHQLVVNRFTDIEKFATLDETYVEPTVEEYTPKVILYVHLRRFILLIRCYRNT